MIIDKEERTITAANGKWLTNGDTYGKKVYLAVNSDGSEWREVDTRPDPVEPPADGAATEWEHKTDQRLEHIEAALLTTRAEV